MIYDMVGNAQLYYGLTKKLDIGLKFMKDYDVSKMDTENGRKELGDGVFALFQNNKPADESKQRFEAHRKYIDIQYLVSGDEYITVLEKTPFTPSEAYSDEKDAEFYTDPVCGARLTMTAGSFAVFFPNDAHKPCIKNKAETNKKIVIKVPV